MRNGHQRAPARVPIKSAPSAFFHVRRRIGRDAVRAPASKFVFMIMKNHTKCTMTVVTFYSSYTYYDPLWKQQSSRQRGILSLTGRPGIVTFIRKT